MEAIYQELKSKHGGKYSGPQCRLWAEAIDVGRRTSKVEPPLGTLVHNVTKNTANSAISDAFVDLAKTVMSALKCNKMPPKQVGQSACATPVSSAGLRSALFSTSRTCTISEAGALSLDEFETQKTVALKQMGDL